MCMHPLGRYIFSCIPMCVFVLRFDGLCLGFPVCLLSCTGGFGVLVGLWVGGFNLFFFLIGLVGGLIWSNYICRLFEF